MRFEIVKVTPEMAAKFLSRNEGNRKLREAHAHKLARAITDNRYKLTHQPAAVTKKGKLIDGQHRMRAVMIANRAVEMVIAFDAPEDSFAVLDAGLMRSMADRLRSDKTNTTICTQLFRIMVRQGQAQEYEIETMLDAFKPALESFAAIPKHGYSRGFKAAHIAAVVMRLAESIRNDDEDGKLRVQWKVEKLHRKDLTGAPPILTAFYRQLAEGVANLDLGVAPQTDQFCRAWTALDPEKENLNRLQINDHSLDVRAAREIFHDVTEHLFV